MLNKIIEFLYNKVFINIVVNKATTTVYIEVNNSNGNIVFSDEKEFQTLNIDNKMYNFIEANIKISPYYYISVLDTTALQGAIPSCNDKKLLDFIDKSSVKHNCYNNRWFYHTSKIELDSLTATYKKIGLDFVFSPFVILSRFFKDKIDTHMAMFIFIEDNYLSLSVFDNSELLYGVHLDMEYDDDGSELAIDEIDETEVELDIPDEIEIDDIDVLEEMDGLEGLDDFGDIEDLDSLDEIDEFADTKDMEEELAEEAESSDNTSESQTESFTEDYRRFSLIQSSVSNFYKDERFKSKFIESVYIADGVGVSSDLKKYLEEEMFLSVYIRKVDIAMELCALAKMEVK